MKNNIQFVQPIVFGDVGCLISHCAIVPEFCGQHDFQEIETIMKNLLK